MTSTSLTYHEDFFTLKDMIRLFDGSEQVIREIQKHGLMLPEMVKFGSEEIEIYSPLDRNIGRRIQKDLGKRDSLSHAVVSAQAYIAELYRVAHGSTSTGMEHSSGSAQLPSRPRRQKLFVLSELLDALEISEEFFQKIGQLIRIEPMVLVIPGRTIEYYFEDDYLRLRYILALISQGYRLEKAADLAYDWGMSELW